MSTNYVNYHQEPFVCGTGVKLPGIGMFSVIDTEFHDFDNCTVFEACGSCKDLQGGFMSEYSGITYNNSPNKGKFQWQFETFLVDLVRSSSSAKLLSHSLQSNISLLRKVISI